MRNIQIGDIVARKSYGGDIYFKVDNIVEDQEKEYAMLRGLFYRLCADAPLDDLERKERFDVNMSGRQLIRVANR